MGLHPGLLLLLLLLQHFPSSLQMIDIWIPSNPIRTFRNVSLGGPEQTQSFGCNKVMHFTPNRHPQEYTLKDYHAPSQLGFILALGGHSNEHYDYGPYGSLNGLMAIWDSWVENFFTVVSNTTSIVMLLDERDFKRQNYTSSKVTYIDSILINNMGASPADCVHFRNRRHFRTHEGSDERHSRHRPAPTGCTSNFLDLDEGYRVYYIDVNAIDNTTDNQPFIIFAGIRHFPPPEWAKNEDEEHLYIHYRPYRLPRGFKTNYGYVKMTNWYSYHMLGLQILDYFDYGGKLDNDVSFVNKFPTPNLPLMMNEMKAKMLVTEAGWYNDDPRVAQGTKECLYKYMEQMSRQCGFINSQDQIIPGGINATILWESNLNLTFRAHFLVFWLGLYTSSETVKLAKYWNEFSPRGMWDYRWGDQQWWPRPIAMFGSGNVDTDIYHYWVINSTNEKYVVHKEYPRSYTVAKTSYFNFSGSNKLIRSQQYELAKKPFVY